MKHPQKLATMILAAAMLFTAFAVPAAAAQGTSSSEETVAQAVYQTPEDYLGHPMPDFSLQTLDGKTFTLSEVLKEKKVVLLNLWATWCPPCEREFPFMEEAYRMYQEDVAVIAASIEPDDTVSVLKEYVESHGMTFDVARDEGLTLRDRFVSGGIPTTVVVDRFGNVVLIEVGAQSSVEPFANLFQVLLSDAYTETKVLKTFPAAIPDVDQASEEELAGAMNAEGAKIHWSNPEYFLDFPMVVTEWSEMAQKAEEDAAEAARRAAGAAVEAAQEPTEAEPAEAEETQAPAPAPTRLCLTNSNAGKDSTSAYATASFTTRKDEVFAFDFCTSTESIFDFLTIYIDGARVKRFGGSHEWTTYAIAFAAAGDHTVTIAYEKDQEGAKGADRVWIDDARILSGEEAQAALSANPSFPYDKETTLTVCNENAKEIKVTGDNAEYFLNAYFGCQKAYVCGEKATVKATLNKTVDPEAAYLYSNYDGMGISAADAQAEDGAILTTCLHNMDVDGYFYTAVYLRESYETAAGLGVLLFPDKEHADYAFKTVAPYYGFTLSWNYVEEPEPEATSLTEASYTVFCRDQDGNPVSGCIVNFCADELCAPVRTDENGIARFVGKPYPYHVQLAKAPAGYSFDKEKEWTMDVKGGELTITVTKNK
ncbi:MAG: redoxin domain-containing protein [Lachnospiraceae bacterium]|nr:redoxin domain-containing protein [Lachnospiraceae bacterium]